MKRPRHSSFPMAIEEAEELAAELSEFDYRETDDADRRRYYKVEKWTRDSRVDRTLYAPQVKPVGVTNVAHGFSRNAPYLYPWRLFVLRTLPTPPKAVDLPRETIAEPVSLFDLHQHHCRWPVGGVGAAMQFCGADKHGDHPYCLRHSRRAYSSLASRAAEKQRWLQRNRAA
jgi:GcrA cell cycle regulator